MNTLKNTFHNTEAKTKLSEDELFEISRKIFTGRATPQDKATQKRIWKKLCGIERCTCGDTFGRREER